MHSTETRKSWIALLLAACLASVVPAYAQVADGDAVYREGRGPIPLRNGRPYNLLFLQFLPESADALPVGKSRYRLQWDIFNNLLIPAPGQEATVVEDNEYERLLFTWQRGLGKDLEVSAFVPLLWRNGGFLDAPLSAWHRFWGLPGNAEDDPFGRDHYAKFHSILRVVNASGKVVIDQGNAFGLGDASLTLKRGLIRATSRSALAARLGLKLPTGNPTLLLGSGNLDIGLSLDARYNVGREFLLYLNLGGVLMGPASHAPGAQSGMAQSMIGVEYRPNRRDSFHFQIDANSLALRTGNGFADRANVTATFGYKRVLDSHHILYAAFSENGDLHNYNLPWFSNIGPDFSTSLGLEWRP